MINKNCSSRYLPSITFLLLMTIIYLFLTTTSKSQVVVGRVIDAETEKPVSDVFIYLMPTAQTISTFRVTDSLGYFIFNNPKVRAFYVKANRFGYKDLMFGKLRIPQSDTLEILIQMNAVPFVLKEIEVTAKKPFEDYDFELDWNGFYKRKEWGFGKFLTWKDFKNRYVGHTSELFNGIPGVIVTGREVLSTRRGGLSQSSGRMQIYIDGFFVEQEYGSSFSALDMISPNNIKAIEVYKSGKDAPYQYSRGRPNGVILIWTGSPIEN